VGSIDLEGVSKLRNDGSMEEYSHVGKHWNMYRQVEV
jgi:hypothetical protein